jgi:tetratricopeptide (TPR) repeat protein
VAALTADRTGRFRFTPASGGLNLYLGNNPASCATLTTRPGQEWQELAVAAPRRAGYEGLWGNHDYFMARSREWVVANPGGWLAGAVGKGLQFLSSREVPRNVDIYLFRRWSTLLGSGVWKWRGFGFPFGLLLPLAVLGVVTRWRQLPRPLLLYLLLYPAAVVLVFVSARYRVPIVPVAAIAAAAGALTIVDRFQARRWRALAVAGAVAAASLLVAVLPGPFCQEQDLEDEYWFLVAASHLRGGDKPRSIECLRRAVELDPGYFEARYQLGSMLLEAGELTEAAANLERAVAERPDSGVARRELGMALGRLGRFDESLRQLERAVELAPLDARAHNNLGVLLAQMGRLEDALVVLERAVSLDPEYRPARENRAWVRGQLGGSD